MGTIDSLLAEHVSFRCTSVVGKAQERTSSWRGLVDPSHASHRPGHPHISWRRMASVPDHWYF
jgi:hypothetical protein